MKKIVLVIIMMIVSANLFAQVSGYMGKRLSIEYNNMFFSALRNPTNANYDSNEKFYFHLFNLNTRSSLSLDYVVTRKRSIGFGVDYFKSRFILTESFKYSYLDDLGVKHNTSTKDEEFFPGGIVSSTCFNLHYTFFFSESLAPLGRYGQFELGLIRYISTYDEDELIGKIEDYHVKREVAQILIEDNNPNFTYYIGLSFGKKRVFYDKIIINSGFQICVIPEVFSINNLFTRSDFVNIGEITDSNYLENFGKERIFNHMLINIKVGIGLLAY